MTSTSNRTTHEKWTAEAIKRFGENRNDWAFRCPKCGNVASVGDFREADGDGSRAAQECIGRLVGKGEGGSPKPCDWAAFGLFRGPVFVDFDDEKEIPAFEFAEECST